MNNIPPYVRISGPGNERLIRDTHSMGIINVNTNAYLESQRRVAEAHKKIQEAQRDKTRLNILEVEVASIKSEMTKISETMQLILKKLD